MERADFVIVGAGSAGSVLAARLSEQAGCTVAVLEAGGDLQSPAVRQPVRWPTLWDSEASWGYATTLQPGYGGRSIPCPRGKGLGGTSGINAMIYIRGEPRDFDDWRDRGNPGWGWQDVLPFFRKSEDQARGASPLHGTGGPMPVSDLASPSPTSAAFVDAAVAAGHARLADFNGEDRAGAGMYQVNQRNGERVTMADAFLRPALGRANLQVITQARAMRVLFEGSRATGVEYFQRGQVRRIAAGEVLLCAGAIDSPRLLMLSGVGHPARLEPLGVPVHHALPAVGDHLHDHPGTGLILRLRQPAVLPASSNIAEAGLFMRSAQVQDGYATHLQFFCQPCGPALAAATGAPWATVIVAQACRPRSRGSVRLRSADAMDTPLIDPAYMTDPHDLDLQIEGVLEARRIAACEPLRSLWADEVMPGPAATDKARLEAYVRASSGCIWHPVGTCRMGPGEDTVVDAQLRVHGLQGLRVADASIMPSITSGNTNAPTVMIAEKAAAMILGR